MHILAPSEKSGEKKKKDPQDTKSVLLLRERERGKAINRLTPARETLFPHVLDQLFTRVKGGRKRGTLYWQNTESDTRAFELEAFNSLITLSFHYILVSLGTKLQPDIKSKESKCMITTWDIIQQPAQTLLKSPDTPIFPQSMPLLSSAKQSGFI